MADDAAAPEGELTESTGPDSTHSPEGSTESPKKTDTTDTTEGEQQVTDEVTDDAGASGAESASPEAAEAESPGEAAGTAEGEGTGQESGQESTGDGGEAEASDEATETAETTEAAPRSPVRMALAVGLIVVLALGGLAGWVGWRAYQSYQAEQQRALFLQVGRQAAINLTTIDFEHADEDVNRILDSATDAFYDDFSNRKDPFIEVVKQAQSKSTGEVTAAGLVEPQQGDQAEVLIAVTVHTSNAGAPEQPPRAWRMRISVKQVGDDVKVSNVEFVP